MQGFLEIDTVMCTLPDCRSADFSALADQEITILEFELFAIGFGEVHSAKRCQVEPAPLNVSVRKVGKLAVAHFLTLVEHLPQPAISNRFESHYIPPHGIGDGVTEHVEEGGLEEGVELGENLAALGPQGVRRIQNPRNPLLLGEGREGDLEAATSFG